MDEMNTLAAELNAVLGVFSDLRVSASLVIVALILWLGWKVVMAERERAAARDARAAETAASPAADAAADSASTTSPQEGTPMTSASAPAPARRTFRLPAVRRRAFGSRRATAPAGGFHVRWGRTALFLAAVGLAVTFLVTGVAAAFGAETVTLAGWSLLGTLASLGLLRVLAVRDQRARRAARAARAEAEAHRAPAHIARGAHVARAAARAAEPAAQPAVDEAAARRDRSKPKGVPTPRRKDQEAARRRPLVPEDRKAAKKADREAMAAERAKMRQALETGDERHMPVRDRGPQKRFVRDYVDARWSIGEFLLPVVFLYILLMFIPGREFQLVLMYSLYALVALVIIDSIILGSRIRKALEAKFGVAEPGTKMYAIMRALQFRRLRLPKPQVKRGQHPA